MIFVIIAAFEGRRIINTKYIGLVYILDSTRLIYISISKIICNREKVLDPV
jgi:hypothetical protein